MTAPCVWCVLRHIVFGFFAAFVTSRRRRWSRYCPRHRERAKLLYLVRTLEMIQKLPEPKR